MDQHGSTSSASVTIDAEGYEIVERLIADRVARHEGPLFTTSTDEKHLWGHYLTPIREDRRQHYNCHSCRRFIQRFGGLVKIDPETGAATSLLWGAEGVPAFFRASFDALRALVEGSKVTGVFLSSASTWGEPRTGEWTHMHGAPSKVHGNALLFGAPLQSADQVMAEKREDYKMLVHALSDYSSALAAQAVRVLKSDTLYRSEKALGIAEWFASLHGKNHNQLWLAIATAPPGFAHVRSTMISTLLDDLKSGLSFEDVSRRWSEKMNPLQYQRPTAPPKAGAIDQAEKLVEKLGCARSLERRFATLADVQVKLWEPKPAKKEAPTDGVFGHLRQPPAKVNDLELPAVAMTWEKFKRTVLPDARQIEVRLPSRGNYYGLVTATHLDAPPILQWDLPERRNPVSWYVYPHGSSPSQWGLSGGWGKVTALFLAPPHWHDEKKFSHQRKFISFSIEGAKDTDVSCLALFPECLKSEFHGIRSVIEAHSKKATVTGGDQASANGLMFDEKNPVTVRVNGSASYTIDRWD